MDNKKNSPYLVIPAFKVQQPLGDFFVIKLNAKELLSISFSEPMKYQDEFGNVKGSQRPKDEKRLKEIARYIESVEMAFPNSIILAANYTEQGMISKDESERWKIEEDNECGIHKIIIPKDARLAAIIDGQHRINAFKYVNDQERINNLQLVCSVYFDLPNSYQAFLFATINSNQKKVDRSLALDQFGYNVDDEPEKAWTPEKFAVFLSRKLNIDKENSPFYQHIKVAPLNPENLFPEGLLLTWVVSTATIVDGIVALISSNAKRDRIDMQQKSIFSGRNREMIKETKDYSPLRTIFIEGKDQTIYDTIINYFKSVNTNLWIHKNKISYITKTVGIQALFDVLKQILNKEKDVEPQTIDFDVYLAKAKNIDFSDKFFQASGIGRSRVKNTLALSIGLIEREKMKKNDLPTYEKLVLSESNPDGNGEIFIWEEEAENAIINILETAEWNYTVKTVNLFLKTDAGNSIVLTDYDSFFNKLVAIAEENYAAYVPYDEDNAAEFRERFNAEDIVESHLVDYEDNLERLGWIHRHGKKFNI